MNEEMQKLTVDQLVKTLRLHQKIQKAVGPNHPYFEKHGQAIREVCAEMARRVKAGDPEAMVAKL